MTQILSEQLIGAWRLGIERPQDGSPAATTATDRPQGRSFTPDGYMSAQLCSPDDRPVSHPETGSSFSRGV